MKIAILFRDGALYSCRRLREATIQCGHLAEIPDPPSCYMNINPAASSTHYKGHRLPHLNAVIPRTDIAITFYGAAALRQFEMLGSYPLSESITIARVRDKLRSTQLPARQGINLPVTGIAHSPDDINDLTDMVGGTSLVVRLVEGTQGVGVMPAEVRQAAESMIDALRGLNAHTLVQKYIKEAQKCDIHCLVVGGEVATAIEWRAKEGDFRSNLYRGGAAGVASIAPREYEIAVRVAQMMALDVTGMDILRINCRPLVTGANASPRLEGAEKITGIDVAGGMIRWIECYATTEYRLKTDSQSQSRYRSWLCPRFLHKLCRSFYQKKLRKVMTSLVVPGLDMLRWWLDSLGMNSLEYDDYQALYLPHIQSFDGVFDVKIDLIDNTILSSAMAGVQPSAVLPLAADLSIISTGLLTVEALLDMQDDNLPKLVVRQSLSVV